MLLDEDEVAASINIIDERSKYIIVKSIFYISCFIAAALYPILVLNTRMSINQYFILVSISIFTPLLISALIEYSKTLRSRNKEISDKIKILKNPTWFEILDRGYLIFLIFFALRLARKVFPAFLNSL